jgi:hypothetical protein
MTSFSLAVSGASFTAYLTIVTSGVALALLAAYLHCRYRCGRGQSGSFNRINTLIWTVGGGMVTSLAGHWLIKSGKADEVIEWLGSVFQHLS